MDRFIVAEVSQNWHDGAPTRHEGLLLSQQFERVINVNDGRGYRLVSFTVSHVMTSPDDLTETLIAVFERRD